MPRQAQANSAARGWRSAAEVAVGIEHVDKAVTRTGHVIMLFGVLLRIGDKRSPVYVLDAERRIAGRDVGS